MTQSAICRNSRCFAADVQGKSPGAEGVSTHHRRLGFEPDEGEGQKEADWDSGFYHAEVFLYVNGLVVNPCLRKGIEIFTLFIPSDVV